MEAERLGGVPPRFAEARPPRQAGQLGTGHRPQGRGPALDPPVTVATADLEMLEVVAFAVGVPGPALEREGPPFVDGRQLRLGAHGPQHPQPVVVADTGQQRPTGPQHPTDLGQGRDHVGGGQQVTQRVVDAHDHVEDGRGERQPAHVGRRGRKPQATRARLPSRPRHRHRAHIGARHPVPQLGQPDRLGADATSTVQNALSTGADQAVQHPGLPPHRGLPIGEHTVVTGGQSVVEVTWV